jgi:hypothetical protein
MRRSSIGGKANRNNPQSQLGMEIEKSRFALQQLKTKQLIGPRV